MVQTLDDQIHAHRYRLAQAQRLLDLFKDAHGRPAATVDELEQWVGSPEGRAATAYHRGKDGKIVPYVPTGRQPRQHIKSSGRA